VSREQWLVGLLGPLAAYILAALLQIGAILVGGPRPRARTLPVTTLLAALMACANLLVLAIVGAPRLELWVQVPLAGALAGAAMAQLLRVVSVLQILPRPALAVPFALDLAALWVVARLWP